MNRACEAFPSDSSFGRLASTGSLRQAPGRQGRAGRRRSVAVNIGRCDEGNCREFKMSRAMIRGGAGTLFPGVVRAAAAVLGHMRLFDRARCAAHKSYNSCIPSRASCLRGQSEFSGVRAFWGSIRWRGSLSVATNGAAGLQSDESSDD